MGMRYEHGAWQQCHHSLSAAEAPQLCVTSARAKHAFLPPDSITFRVRTNHRGIGKTWEHKAPEAGRHSDSHSPDSPREMLLSLQCSTQTLSDTAEQMGSCSQGDNKGGRQLCTPDWTYCSSFTPLGCRLGWTSAGQTFPDFPLTLTFWQNQGFGSAEVLIHLPSFPPGCNLPVAWLSMPIIQALSSSQGGTTSPKKTQPWLCSARHTSLVPSA